MRTFTYEEMKQMSDGFPPADCDFSDAITALSQECIRLLAELEDTKDDTLVKAASVEMIHIKEENDNDK